MPLLSQFSANSFYFPGKRDSIENRLAVSHTRSPQFQPAAYPPSITSINGTLEEITPCSRF